MTAAATMKPLRMSCCPSNTARALSPRLEGRTLISHRPASLVVAGRLNKQIAGELAISIKTVEKHRQQVMNKLNIHDVAGLTRYAISKGMVERSMPATVV